MEISAFYKKTIRLCSFDYAHRSHKVDSMLLPSGNPFKCHEEVWSLQPMIPPERFDIFPPAWDPQKV